MPSVWKTFLLYVRLLDFYHSIYMFLSCQASFDLRKMTKWQSHLDLKNSGFWFLLGRCATIIIRDILFDVNISAVLLSPYMDLWLFSLKIMFYTFLSFYTKLFCHFFPASSPPPSFHLDSSSYFMRVVWMSSESCSLSFGHIDSLFFMFFGFLSRN